MKVSIKWLREYVPVTMPHHELAHRLSMSGTEVGGMTVFGGWDNVFVGRVVSVDPHPNADRLRLATVDLGAERHTVVCGAPNVAPGQMVPFAKEGARLIDGHTGQAAVLHEATIRGVRSAGMVCSEKELGISDDHTAIMVLPENAPLGAPLADYLGDVIFDLDVTPNRPDCLSVIGVAREVAVLTDRPLHEPDASYPEAGPDAEGLVTVQIAAPDLCSRYCASYVEGVTVGQSPRWLQERLVAAGMRPINNIVDITNYVMLEYGQPLHAFDYRRLEERRIVVRRAGSGERIVTLDGSERELSEGMLVIGDGAGAVAVAGVMGGLASEVTAGTTSVLLESANFNHASVRRTAAGLRLPSEASLRFSKGISPELAPVALCRATQLLVEVAGGKAAKGFVDVYPGRVKRQPVLLKTERVRQVLGVEVAEEEIGSILAALGFTIKKVDAKAFSVTVPYWRMDVQKADDVVEEVARIHGYDQIPTTLPCGHLPEPRPNEALSLRERVRDVLVASGMQEIITYPLVSKAMLARVLPDADLDSIGLMRLANPMVAEQEYLRPTLRHSLLATLAANQRTVAEGLKLFEVASVFRARENDLPEEREMLTGVMAGPREERSWLTGGEQVDFFDAKGMLEGLLGALGVEARFDAATDGAMLPGRTACITVGDRAIGLLGEVHPAVAEAFDVLAQPAYLFELDLAALLPLAGGVRRYQSIPRTPGNERDLAVILDIDVPARSVQDAIEASPLVRRVVLFDLYQGGQVPPGKKSLAYSITYQDPSRTLTDEEVTAAHQSIVARLAKELGAVLRS